MRVLGIDYGRRRIGLAISDPTGVLARPWKTLSAHADVTGAAASLCAEVMELSTQDEGLAAVVLGHPRRLGGEASDQTREVEVLATELRARLSVPVVLQDERLSSREAEGLLARRVKDWRERKAMLDALSAAVILQDYLDAQSRETAGVEEGDL